MIKINKNGQLKRTTIYYYNARGGLFTSLFTSAYLNWSYIVGLDFRANMLIFLGACL